MNAAQEDVNIEHKDMLKYCQDIINVAPENSIEYKIAQLALIQLKKEINRKPVPDPKNKLTPMSSWPIWQWGCWTPT